jgi:hypothetical protein
VNRPLHTSSSSRYGPEDPSSTTATVGTPETQSAESYETADSGECISEEKLLAGVGAWVDGDYASSEECS